MIRQAVLQALYRLRRFSGGVNLVKMLTLIAFVWVIAYGTFGSYFLRQNFNAINSLSDAFYYTIATYSTVGDDTIYPLTTLGKYFVITMIVFGFGTFAMFGSIFIYSLMARVQRLVTRIQGDKIYMKNHIILCGYSVITEILINKFIKSATPFVLLDNAPHPELNSGDGGNFIFVSVPNRLESLKYANIAMCKMVIATSDMDSENILAAVNANKLKQEFLADYKIVARVLYEENIEVAKLNGATHVISPTLMAANAIVELMP